MIAMALANKPELLIADEPTTALDVTIQDQILRQLRELDKEYGASIIFITHDLGVVAELCDRVLVMYGGLIMEEARIEDIFERPGHPYTMGLLHSIPDVEQEKSERLEPIPGSPPDMTNPPAGCPFAPRCSYARKVCAGGGWSQFYFEKRENPWPGGRIRLREINLCQDYYTDVRPYIGTDPFER